MNSKIYHYMSWRLVSQVFIRPIANHDFWWCTTTILEYSPHDGYPIWKPRKDMVDLILNQDLKMKLDSDFLFEK